MLFDRQIRCFVLGYKACCLSFYFSYESWALTCILQAQFFVQLTQLLYSNRIWMKYFCVATDLFTYNIWKRITTPTFDFYSTTCINFRWWIIEQFNVSMRFPNVSLAKLSFWYFGLVEPRKSKPLLDELIRPHPLYSNRKKNHISRFTFQGFTSRKPPPWSWTPDWAGRRASAWHAFGWHRRKSVLRSRPSRCGHYPGPGCR